MLILDANPWNFQTKECCFGNLLKLSVQYNVINALTFIYLSHTQLVSTDSCSHHQATLQYYVGINMSCM